MNFNRIGFNWIKWLTCVGLAWLATSAQAVAPGDYVPLKPKQVPGDTSVPLPVDPERCSKGDKKYIYWAAKEQVFRLRFDPDLPVYAIPDRDLSAQGLQARKEIPPPPDPKEPEGCYGNPLRGLSMPYFEQFTARVYQDLMGRPPRLSGMYRSGSATAWETEFGPGFWPGINKRAFQARPNCSARPSGMKMCLLDGNQDPSNFKASHVYVIPQSMVPSYAGKKDISIVIGDTLASQGEVYAKSNFKLFGNVLVRLNPEIKPNKIDEMIDYHYRIIKHVIDAHVADYDWRLRR